MLVGRKAERETLLDAFRSDESQFVALYGRRRVGKTYLVRQVFENRFAFQHAGVAGGTLKEQLFAFEASLADAGLAPAHKARCWMEAFESLKELVRRSSESRKVIFIDELSWMDTRGSDLMRALESFWNGWASARNDVLLIVCASATSWMLSKVIHNKGGLYNRLTCRIHLQPFTLSECEHYAQAKGLRLTRSQIVEGYMVFGGVPYYWNFVRPGQSLAQNIDGMFFAKDAPLRDEFDFLYASIFRSPAHYIAIIEALGRRKAGLTRTEIIEATGIPNSGDLTHKLEELESCGFIRTYRALGKRKKDAVYQLVDFFTLFHFKFLADSPTDEHFWSNQLNTPAMNAWAGLAFERVCMAHATQIKRKLGVLGVSSEEYSWRCSADEEAGYHGSQVDLLIMRRDQVINLCEMKYASSELVVTAKLAEDIERKVSDVALAAGSKYAIHPVLVTMLGVVDGPYSHVAQAVVTADDLFAGD